MQIPIHKILKYLSTQFELICWVMALGLLFFMSEGRSDISLCPISLFGFGKCWGCGIGHAMHDAMRMHFSASFRHHPMGIPAVLILINRIRELILIQIKQAI